MKLHKVLGACAAVLAVAFGVQVAMRAGQEPQMKLYASWVENPASLAEAKNLSTQIVRGRVTNIRRASDLVTRVPGEPGGVDRIPIEIVTVQVSDSFKGARPASVEIFRVGDASPRGVGPIPPEAQRTPGRTPWRPSAAQVRQVVSVEDDPPYAVGQEVVLFLRSGPTVSVGGQAVRTLRTVSPVGRLHVSNNALVPAVNRGFAAGLRGRLINDIAPELRR